MSKIITVTFIIVQSAFLKYSLCEVQFRVIRQWNYINYTWPSVDTLSRAIMEERYIPENIVLAGIGFYGDWYYLTMPRMKKGVSATLGRIPARGNNTSPSITPFPSWEFNTEGDCNALQNVQNIQIDTKDQLWIIDGGHTLSLTATPIRNCSPKLIIYDTKNNNVATMHVFSEMVASKQESFLYDLVLDEDFVYITDNSARDPGIIVYSRKDNEAWKIRHSESMRADPNAHNFKINGVLVSAAINIAGIAIGPKDKNSEKQILYCPLSSFNLYSVSSAMLKNKSYSNNGAEYTGEIKLVGQKASQTDGMLMTNEGTLYYDLLSDNSIAKWNTRTPFASGQKILSRDSRYIQWTNSFATDFDGNLIVLTNNLQDFIHERLNLTEANTWLLSAYIGETSYNYIEPDDFAEDNFVNNHTGIRKSGGRNLHQQDFLEILASLMFSLSYFLCTYFCNHVYIV